jgi:branched-chain amino acid transport system ATP-binding protein
LGSSISIEGLSAGYGAVRVLEDVTLNVASGETVVLLGTNGNGKSTLMKWSLTTSAALPPSRSSTSV